MLHLLETPPLDVTVDEKDIPARRFSAFLYVV